MRIDKLFCLASSLCIEPCARSDLDFQDTEVTLEDFWWWDFLNDFPPSSPCLPPSDPFLLFRMSSHHALRPQDPRRHVPSNRWSRWSLRPRMIPSTGGEFITDFVLPCIIYYADTTTSQPIPESLKLTQYRLWIPLLLLHHVRLSFCSHNLKGKYLDSSLKKQSLSNAWKSLIESGSVLHEWWVVQSRWLITVVFSLPMRSFNPRCRR